MDILSLAVTIAVTLVIILLVCFIPWYMRTEPRKNFFSITIISFSFSILILAILEVGLLFLIFWEILGITSYLLVCWWKGREYANFCALVRLLSSRIRDVCLFIVVFGSNNFESYIFFFYFLLAISTKSAQLMFFPWLLGAIERPGPVSALLHSSTLVLARVILSFRLQEFRLISSILLARIIGVMIRILGTSLFTDLKKRIACSTVYNVGFIFIWIYLRESNVLYLHIITHAIVKSATFVLLRVSSHLINVQDIRGMIRNTHKNLITLFIILVSILSLLPLIGVVSFKENGIESLSATSINVLILSFLVLNSVIRFVFIIEYVLIIDQRVSNFPKFLPVPSLVQTFVLWTFLIFLVLTESKIITPIRSISIILSYPVLLFIRVVYTLLTYRRSFLKDLHYVTVYNSYILRNASKIKVILLNIEFHLLLQILYNTENFIYNLNWYKAKLNSRAVFFAILFTLLLLTNL